MGEVGEMPIPKEEHPEVDHVKHVIGEVLTRTYKDTSREYMEAYDRVQNALPKESLPRSIVDRLDGVARVGAAVGGATAQVKDYVWSITRLFLHVHPALGLVLHLVPGDIFSIPDRAGIRIGSEAAKFIAHRVYGGANRQDAIVEGITNGFIPETPETKKVFVGRGKPS